MSDVFISYARETEGAAQRIVEALQASAMRYGATIGPGSSVVRRDAEERLAAAKVVLDLGRPRPRNGLASEASRARAMGKLVS